MEVRLIENKELLESVELFKIENLLWGTEKIAKTYGYIGFVPGEGLYIKLVCVEKNPLRIYKKDQDPVYKDSAMAVSYTHLTLPTKGHGCRSRWSPYH